MLHGTLHTQKDMSKEILKHEQTIGRYVSTCTCIHAALLRTCTGVCTGKN